MVMLIAACATEEPDPRVPDEPQQFKVIYKDMPIAPGPMLSLASPCFEVPLLDVDTETPGSQHECSMTRLYEDGVEHVMPACDAFPDARPCWRLVEDPLECYEAEHLKVDVERDAAETSPYHLVIQCVSA